MNTIIMIQLQSYIGPINLVTELRFKLPHQMSRKVMGGKSIRFPLLGPGE